MKEFLEKNKKTILSISLVVAMILVVVGISYAAFTFIQNGTQNEIASGQISMSYTEAENGLDITDALPMTSSEGMQQTKYFEFSVRATSTGKVLIPYEISIVPQKYENQLDASNVYLYLTDENDNQVVAPILASKVNIKGEFGRSSSFLLERDEFDFQGESNETRTYRLRMWLKEDYQVPNTGIAYTYGVKINVDANTKFTTAGDALGDKTYMVHPSGYNEKYRGYKNVSVNFVYGIDTSNAALAEYTTTYETAGEPLVWDISEKQDGSVIAWLEDNVTDVSNYYDLYIGSEGQIYAKDLSSMFYDASSIVIDNLNTSETTNMYSMFRGANLAGVDLSFLDTSSATNMRSMFSEVQGITELDLSHFDTSNVRDMQEMFAYTSLTSINLSSFDTSNVREMQNMFLASTKLQFVDMRNVTFEGVSEYWGMFWREYMYGLNPIQPTIIAKSEAEKAVFNEEIRMPVASQELSEYKKVYTVAEWQALGNQ